MHCVKQANRTLEYLLAKSPEKHPGFVELAQLANQQRRLRQECQHRPQHHLAPPLEPHPQGQLHYAYHHSLLPFLFFFSTPYPWVYLNQSTFSKNNANKC
jgi:hypothetical protein